MSNKRCMHLTGIDRISRFLGEIVKWVVAALVLVGFYEVIARYLFGAPTVWGYEFMSMLGATIAALGWGYVESQNAHVRVDVFYDRCSPRAKLIIDIVGGCIFALPLFGVYLYTAFTWMIKAYRTNEVLMGSFWYPSAVPIRAVIFAGFVILFAQFLANVIRKIVAVTSPSPSKEIPHES